MTKVENSFIGFIIGDALGVPLEFEPRENLIKNPVLDMMSYGRHNVKGGTWSANTSLMLATMESVINKKELDYSNMMKNYVSFFKSRKYLACERPFGLNQNVKKILREYQKNKKINDINKQSTENSSLKRCLPIAFYVYYHHYSDNDIYSCIKEFSSLTDTNEIVILGCYLYVQYLNFLFQGKNKLEAYQSLQEINLSYFKEETSMYYERILKDNIANLALKEISTSDYIVDTLESSLWIILNTDSFSEALVGAINLGGDTASIGSITGSIAGYIYASDEVPERWLDKIKHFNYLEQIIEEYEKILKTQ